MDIILAPPVSMVNLIKAFASERRCSVDYLTGPSRNKGAVALRRELIVLLYARGFGLSAIGRRLNRDHTTILYHLKRLRREQPQREAA